LSTGAIANIFKPAVAPTCNYRIKTKHALDRFYSEIFFWVKLILLGHVSGSGTTLNVLPWTFWKTLKVLKKVVV